MVQGTGPIDRPALLIDEDFASVCWSLTDEEKSFLLAAMKKDGCRDPIRYWAIKDKPIEECPILDGHNRYGLCIEHGIPFETVPMEFDSREDALSWIIINQLGRRNATEVQKQYLRGRMYLAKKDAQDSQGDDTAASRARKPSDCNDLDTQVVSAQPIPPNLAVKVGEETGVSERQIHRDASFARSMDRLALKSPTLRDAAISGAIPKKDAEVLADAKVDVLRDLEAVPEENLRAAAKATVEAIQKHKPSGPRTREDSCTGRPIVRIKALADLEAAVGKMVRGKSDALKETLAACGTDCEWARQHEAAIRALMNQIFDEILAWQRDAEARAAA